MNKMREAFENLFISGTSDMSNDEETFYVFSQGYRAAIVTEKPVGSPLTEGVRKRIFWEGFWAAFCHPVMIYGYGFAAGFVVRGLVA